MQPFFGGAGRRSFLPYMVSSRPTAEKGLFYWSKMGYGIWKAHHGYMKANAVNEYNAAKAVCESFGIEVVAPRRKHWHGVENATALMVEKMSVEQREKLPRYFRTDHYFSVLNEAKQEFSKPSKCADK